MGTFVPDAGGDPGRFVPPLREAAFANLVFEEQSMTIDADPRRLREAREWAYLAAVRAGLDDAGCYQVKLAVSEAVANAIQHGSSGSRDRIGIAAFEADGALVFEVRDSGTFVAPLERPTIDDESGRGLELLALMMDEVEISSTDDGSLLRIAKRL